MLNQQATSAINNNNAITSSSANKTTQSINHNKININNNNNKQAQTNTTTPIANKTKPTQTETTTPDFPTSTTSTQTTTTKPKDDETTTSSTTTPTHQDDDREINFIAKFPLDILLFIVKSIIWLYSFISQPIYHYKQGINELKYQVEGVERSLKAKSSNNSYIWRQVNIDSRQLIFENKINSYDHYDVLIRDQIKTFKDRICYGYRKVLHENWVKKSESDTKLIRQVALSEYNWVNYDEFELQIEAVKRGFLLEGIKSGDKVIIYSDTRPEWQISSQALIRIGAIVVTMYSTLGVDGIIHCVNETGVTHILAQKDKVSKLLKLKSKLPKVKKIIYFTASIDIPQIKIHSLTTTSSKSNGSSTESIHKSSSTTKILASSKASKNVDFEHPEVQFTNFNELLVRGAAYGDSKSIDNYLIDDGNIVETICKLEKLEEESEKYCSKRNRDTIAVIMYTSGSTGIPKGVLITHGNIMETIKSFTYVTKDFVHKPLENVCTAYLPLAHIFEFCIQSTMLFHGVKFGFGTPHTLTNKSPGLIPGQMGDLSLLKPTVMIIVPLVLDRVAQGIKQALKARSYFAEQLITFLINYKIYWQKRYYETPIVDKLVCSKINIALGGRAKYVICGSAPLSSATQTFVKAALNIKLPQGFGTTETCAATACQLFDDQTTENVGIPVAGCYIKLEPWYEANYSPNDKPNPRGEIVVGGGSITAGYFNLDEQTKEAFYTDNEGIRWYRTGDIGEFLPNGNLRIIDRKKDLVKLQNGEYISLGKVESTFKSNPYTDNFCAYANSHFNYIVALAPANELAIRGMAQQIVDSYLRNSPSLSIKNTTNNHDESSSSATSHSSNRKEELEREVVELQEVLALYEADKLNNNDDDDSGIMSNEKQQTNNKLANYNERKMSSLSTTSVSGGTNERLQKLCDNRLIQERLMAYIKGVAQERNLLSLEVPKKILLLAEEWTEDKNLVTAAMKIRRQYIYKRYEKDLEQLYSITPSPSPSQSYSSQPRSPAGRATTTTTSTTTTKTTSFKQ